jgi:antitoxin (DNA-binding transcriptional repressor) of toxin-antitoxin stability system
MINMAKHVIDISELEGASGIAALLARLRAGEEIVIEDDCRPVAVVHPIEPCVRLLSDSLRLAREHGSTVTPDEGFAADVEAGIASHREPLEPPAWD